MDEINTLQDVADSLGLNYMAIWHMSEFGMINETEIIEDLKNGLIFEWLTFIDCYTDSNTNNFEEKVFKLLLKVLGNNMELILTPEELACMVNDSDYAGTMAAIVFSDNDIELERIPIRLNLNQYLFFLEIGAQN